MADQLLQVCNLHKQFGRSTAVNDVSFEIRRGEAFGLVGESGSGKTTVARIILGLERASSGSVLLNGLERLPLRSLARRNRRASARAVQMVFQDPYLSLDPRQTAAEAIQEVLALHSNIARSMRDHRIVELGDLVGLDARLMQARPARMSGGQRQRVAIARALAAEPDLLILDEAVAALDVSVQAQVLNVLSDVRTETGVTFLLISHDLAVVRQLCDSVAVMQAGRIVERGRAATVLDEPAHPYTQLLKDSVPRQGWRPRRRRVDPAQLP